MALLMYRKVKESIGVAEYQERLLMIRSYKISDGEKKTIFNQCQLELLLLRLTITLAMLAWVHQGFGLPVESRLTV